MQIFIDESGAFIPPSNRTHYVSCAGALVIPESCYREVTKGFKRLKHFWGCKGKEIKGSQLNEKQVNELIIFLMPYQILFEVVGIDMGLENQSVILQHKLAQAEKITENITQAHLPGLVKDLQELQMSIRNLSDQLYIQAMITVRLTENVLRKATPYFAQREPLTLGKFNWTVDAKDRVRTKYEKLWMKIVFPFLQTISITHPLPLVEGFDYSAFQRFHKFLDEPPDYLRPHVGSTGRFEYVDLDKLLGESFQFLQSHDKIGLQIVDILINAIRRAMNGNLASSGWDGIGRLTVQAEKGNQVIDLISFSGPVTLSKGQEQVPYWRLVRHVQRFAKKMLL